MIESNTFASLYSNLLLCFNNHNYFQELEFNEVKIRDFKVIETINANLCIRRTTEEFFSMNSRPNILKYLCAETCWYFGGSTSLEFISKYSKFWLKLQPIHSYYGALIFKEENIFGNTQYFWAINSLIKDKNSRQAIMHFNNSSHQFFENKDFVCTMYLQLFIRNNKLILISNMRSQDLIKGMTYDIPFFILVQKEAFKVLKYWYPELILGELYHNVGSLHVYESDFKLLDTMANDDSIKEFKLPESNTSLILHEGFIKYIEENKKELCQDKLVNFVLENI